MPSSNADLLERMIVDSVRVDSVPTESQIAAIANDLNSIPRYQVSTIELNEVLRRVHARLQISMDIGHAVTENHHPWLAGRKAKINPFFWNRFREYLNADLKWPPRVVGRLDQVTDEILNLMGNPDKEGVWSRCGLVMGDVQSGKTATYTVLTCKAADAGYKLVILLTGTMENLRRQTQERMDYGFVGLDSSGWLARERKQRIVGAGMKNQTRMAVVFTSRVRDFSTPLVNQLNLRISDMKEPILLVVKKNKRILENLATWLRDFNAQTSGIVENTPLLLIDDEADNASINTNSEQDSPTAINERIRVLLKLFSQTTYIGFTATPFANIFINPDSDDDMRGDDLFPRDFIYALEPPSNYIGPEKIFGDNNEDTSSTLVSIDDADECIPVVHKSTYVVESLPYSLTEAIRAFILVNAIRDLRGEKQGSHRSMLVNVSRFTKVQDQVAELVNVELKEIQTAIQNYSKLSHDNALRIPKLHQLYETWQRHYESAGFTWSQIQESLTNSALPIVVQIVNQRTGTASLDFTSHSTDGLRVIAVGGNSLSRGLTLEGLTISYFHRSTKMYDTLLQMGRWFGFRTGYEDLCRIWMGDEAIHWYRHITSASVELRNEIRRMSRLGLTPKDFGLKVRAHPDSLLITAQNKMRSAQEFTRLISVSGQSVETAELCMDKSSIATNMQRTEEFIANLHGAGFSHEVSPWSTPIWRNIPKSLVVTYLRSFITHPQSLVFQQNALANFLSDATEPKLDKWDVAIPMPREGETFTLCGIEVHLRKRKVTIGPDKNYIGVSGRSLRVGAPEDEREGFTEEEVQEIKAQYGKENLGRTIPGHVYRQYRKCPLLLINFIKPLADVPEMNDTVLPAIGLSFPEFEDSAIAKKVTYKINVVEYRNLYGEEPDDDVEANDGQQ